MQICEHIEGKGKAKRTNYTDLHYPSRPLCKLHSGVKIATWVVFLNFLSPFGFWWVFLSFFSTGKRYSGHRTIGIVFFFKTPHNSKDPPVGLRNWTTPVQQHRVKQMGKLLVCSPKTELCGHNRCSAQSLQMVWAVIWRVNGIYSCGWSDAFCPKNKKQIYIHVPPTESENLIPRKKWINCYLHYAGRLALRRQELSFKGTLHWAGILI